MIPSAAEKQRHFLPQTCLIASITLQSIVNAAINILCQLFQNTLCLAGCSDSHEMLFKNSTPALCFSVSLSGHTIRTMTVRYDYREGCQ